MGDLYIVATPIGNLEDISIRAIRILGEVDLIVAEDTRTTRKLLIRYKIGTPITRYNEHNNRKKLPSLMKSLKSKDIALVSDAGTPCICDPGIDFVGEAARSGFRVIPIPGASSPIVGLTVSGLPSNGFLFLGFLPRKYSSRIKLLGSVKPYTYTIVALEAPHRLRDTLGDVIELLGDRDIAVCRELTKINEEIFRGSTSQALLHFFEPRGEFTLIISGAPECTPPKNPESAMQELDILYKKGLRSKEAVELVAHTSGLSRNDVYQIWLELKNKRSYTNMSGDSKSDA